MGQDSDDRLAEIEQALAMMQTPNAAELGMSAGEFIEKLFPIVALLRRFEDDFNRDLESQLLFFRFLEATASLASETEVAKKWVFTLWATESPNNFAAAYRLGRREVRADEDLEIERRIERAAEGRRKIGDTTRTRISQAADGLQHLTKETAASEIADSVGLSAGRVRRYLSELYPGSTWKPK